MSVNRGAFSLKNSRLLRNASAAAGGGLSVFDAAFTISDCEFHMNSGLFGGGMSANNTIASMNDVMITENSAFKHGGGIRLEDSEFTLDGVRIKYNTAGAKGGNLFGDDANGIVRNCIVSWGTAGLEDGNSSVGGFHLRSGFAVISDTYICNNVGINIVGDYLDTLTNDICE